MVIDNVGGAVGTMWLGVHPERPSSGYVYDIEIESSRRGQGLGRAAMLAAERLLIKSGFDQVGLNVFGFNAPARRLYESLGYRVEATQMSKSL